VDLIVGRSSLYRDRNRKKKFKGVALLLGRGLVRKGDFEPIGVKVAGT
jgi:hypothetical protein